jgi:uncharacterized protein (TIGR03435 family)
MRLVTGMLWAALLSAQPAFEVASIKAGTGHEIGGVHNLPGGRIEFRGCTLEFLIQEAFEVHRFQVSGGTAWMRSERYDIDAKPPESSESSRSRPPYPKVPMNHEQLQMLQALLAERFQLQYRRDTREGPIYLLIKGSKPLGMTDSKDKNEFPWSRVTARGLVGTNESMSDLAWRLSQDLERPVVDRTEIAGSFDFDVPYSAGDDPDLVAETLATVQELGLKLEASKGPVETIVIERAEKPSAN